MSTADDLKRKQDMEQRALNDVERQKEAVRRLQDEKAKLQREHDTEMDKLHRLEAVQQKLTNERQDVEKRLSAEESRAA